MAELRTQPKELESFLGSGYNTVCSDALAQDGHLGLQEAYLGIVPWSEELGDQPEDSLEGIGHGSLTPPLTAGNPLRGRKKTCVYFETSLEKRQAPGPFSSGVAVSHPANFFARRAG
jgi:hypothetical protein